MKGCLVLQRRFVYLGHELAILLKEKHGIDEFCAYVQVRDGYDFLASQKDIRYTNLLLEEDIHKEYLKEKIDHAYLAELEREYGSLWKFISVDRIVRFGQLLREYPHDTSPYSYEEMLRLVQVHAKRITAFLDAEKPDFVFTYQPGALGTLLLYTIAKKRGIKVLTTVIPMTRDLISLSERYDRLTGVEELFGAYSKEQPGNIPRYKEAKEFIEEFRNKPFIYSEVYSSLIKYGKWRQFDFLLPRNLFRTFRSLIGTLKNWGRKREMQTDYSTIHPFDYLVDRIKRKLRNLIGADDLYDAYDPARPHVFFPLHVEPEIAVLLLAPFDTDQISIVRRLARSLPVGMYVYVKEHPQMTPYRSRSFYKELKKIPNVKLLRPEIPSFDLIRSAALVAIITGAAGWEACLFGKPVITFGEVFYNALSSVVRSKVPEELPQLVAQQLQKMPDYEELIRFVAALFEDSAHCDILYLWEFETDRGKKRKNLAGFAALIARKINSSH